MVRGWVRRFASGCSDGARIEPGGTSTVRGRSVAGAASAIPLESGITAIAIRRFERRGFILFAPGSRQGLRATLLALSELFGVVIRHVLSEGDGVVAIRPAPHLAEFGDVFTHRPVKLHTDGAFRANPPSAVALQCEVAPEHGGNVCLVDGGALYAHLLETCPEDRKSVV